MRLYRGLCSYITSTTFVIKSFFSFTLSQHREDYHPTYGHKRINIKEAVRGIAMKQLALMTKAGVMVYSTEGNNACPPRLSSNVGDWLLAIIARDEWRGMGRGSFIADKPYPVPTGMVGRPLCWIASCHRVAHRRRKT